MDYIVCLLPQVYWCIMDLLDGPAMDEALQQSGPVSEITAIKV
jgi:hypothetical protein